jgi:hypothetical protein
LANKGKFIVYRRYLLLLSFKNPRILLANSEAPTCRLTHDPSEGPEAWSTPAEISAL